MNEESIGLFEAKTHLSELIERVQAGESFQITKRGQPVAQLTPLEGKKAKLRLGCGENPDYWMSKDFDAPLEDLKEYME